MSRGVAASAGRKAYLVSLKLEKKQRFFKLKLSPIKVFHLGNMSSPEQHWERASKLIKLQQASNKLCRGREFFSK